jgi:hypothetical protein
MENCSSPTEEMAARIEAHPVDQAATTKARCDGTTDVPELSPLAHSFTAFAYWLANKERSALQ